tara:strand:- start:353 stop:457 length:105 start_codon:yes stop_codon:yes gene_type:complete
VDSDPEDPEDPEELNPRVKGVAKGVGVETFFCAV